MLFLKRYAFENTIYLSEVPRRQFLAHPYRLFAAEKARIHYKSCRKFSFQSQLCLINIGNLCVDDLKKKLVYYLQKIS